MTPRVDTGEGLPSPVFFRSADEQARIFILLCDYLGRHSQSRIRQLLSLELQNLAGNDKCQATRHHPQRSK
jgi:hypothetical protein